MSDLPGSSSNEQQKNESVAEDADESCVNLFDILKEQEEEEATVMAVLGGSDENQCTYSKVRLSGHFTRDKRGFLKLYFRDT